MTIEEARARIAAQRGELRGWRPLTQGDVAVMALQVLGMSRGDPDTVGLRVVLAARTPAAAEHDGPGAIERTLRARSVLGPDDPLAVVHTGETHTGDGDADDPLRWPWFPLVIHVPERQLPAIAGLATDTVPTV